MDPVARKSIHNPGEPHDQTARFWAANNHKIIERIDVPLQRAARPTTGVMAGVVVKAQRRTESREWVIGDWLILKPIMLVA